MRTRKIPLKVVIAPAIGVVVEAPPVLVASEHSVDYICGRCAAVLLHADEGQVHGILNPLHKLRLIQFDRCLVEAASIWPAPGSEDTELGVLMELEVGHGETEVTREFKLEAVRLIKDRGVSYAQASQDLNVHPSQLRDWVKKFSDDPQQAFPGNGQMKPEQREIAQLKREVAKLKAERDILKKAAAYFAKEST